MKPILYKGHTITVTPYGRVFTVKVSGPDVVARAGTFASPENAIAYGKGRVDGKDDDE